VPSRLTPSAVAFGADQKDRLFAYDEVVDGQPGGDFHSLVWEREVSDRWHVHLVITREAFGTGSAQRRWVSDVHSLDPERGTAILKVAEESEPVGLLLPAVKVQYSWCEWDLIHNVEMKRLQPCVTPFDVLHA